MKAAFWGLNHSGWQITPWKWRYIAVIAVFYPPLLYCISSLAGEWRCTGVAAAVTRPIIPPFLVITLQRHSNAMSAKKQYNVLNPFSSWRSNAIAMPCLPRSNTTFWTPSAHDVTMPSRCRVWPELVTHFGPVEHMALKLRWDAGFAWIQNLHFATVHWIMLQRCWDAVFGYNLKWQMHQTHAKSQGMCLRTYHPPPPNGMRQNSSSRDSPTQARCQHIL